MNYRVLYITIIIPKIKQIPRVFIILYASDALCRSEWIAYLKVFRPTEFDNNVLTEVRPQILP